MSDEPERPDVSLVWAQLNEHPMFVIRDWTLWALEAVPALQARLTEAEKLLVRVISPPPDDFPQEQKDAVAEVLAEDIGAFLEGPKL